VTRIDHPMNVNTFESAYVLPIFYLLDWIERRLQEVEKKTKQNQSVIDNKSNFPTDRPKQILDRILAID